jgi:Protein of unknown function (DUF2786)
MTASRDKILHKIRALMAKTVEAGCTESEAIAALEMASAFIDSYEVTNAELALSREEKAVLKAADPDKDPHDIGWHLLVGVGRFTETKIWRRFNGARRGSKECAGVFVYLGAPSDCELATYLVETLAAFCRDELTRYLMTHTAPRGQRRFVINGFVAGITMRITKRLIALANKSRKATQSNSTALVVIKQAAIDDYIKANDLHFRSNKPSRRQDGDAHAAGAAAGDRASFARPINGTGRNSLLA